MLDVFVIGHGFMDQTDTITLAVPFLTYVKDGRMLDGRKTAAVVEGGPSEYQITNTNDEEFKANPSGRTLKEHYLCSDLASYKDVNRTVKWQNKGAGSRQVLVAGILFTLPGGTYLFFTANSRAVRLSRIANCLRPVIGGAPWQIHWTACRSFISGNDDNAKLSAINGGDLVNAQSLT